MEIGLEQARGQLGDLVTRTLAGEEIILTRNGKPAARLVPIAQPRHSVAVFTDDNVLDALDDIIDEMKRHRGDGVHVQLIDDAVEMRNKLMEMVEDHDLLDVIHSGFWPKKHRLNEWKRAYAIKEPDAIGGVLVRQMIAILDGWAQRQLGDEPMSLPVERMPGAQM